jgi:SAM-dependent methyltransferase
MTPVDYSFTRYLAAKKSVDDRALNRHVCESLGSALPAATPSTPLRVLEVGAGVGTMLERLLDWGSLTYAAYTGIDADPTSIDEAHRRLPAWASGQGFDVEASRGQMRFQREGGEFSVEFEAIDVFDFVAREQGHRRWDLLIAHAIMDLLDVPTALLSLFRLLRAGGLFYFTIVFDGATIFQPEIKPALDVQVETLYHQTMDQRITAGRLSQTGWFSLAPTGTRVTRLTSCILFSTPFIPRWKDTLIWIRRVLPIGSRGATPRWTRGAWSILRTSWTSWGACKGLSTISFAPHSPYLYNFPGAKMVFIFRLTPTSGWTFLFGYGWVDGPRTTISYRRPHSAPH